MEELIFNENTTIEFASNKFVNVPIILQYEDAPLISVVKTEDIHFTTEVPIYHSDGTYLAKVRGNRVYPTEEGQNADVEVRKLPQVWVCEVEGRTAFEIHQQAGDAFRTEAELYTPDGRFVKIRDSPEPELYDADGSRLQVGGVTIIGNTFKNLSIGVWIQSDGSVSIGVA